MPHGNAVLTGITLESRPAGSNAEWQRVPFRWAWADMTQTDRDFAPVYLLDGMQPLGWAADGNDKASRSLSNPFPERICLGMRLTTQLDMA